MTSYTPSTSIQFTAALAYRFCLSLPGGPTNSEVSAMGACHAEWQDYLRLSESKFDPTNAEGSLVLRKPEDGWYALALLTASALARNIRVGVGLGLLSGDASEVEEAGGAATQTRVASRLGQQALDSLELHPGMALYCTESALQEEFTIHAGVLSTMMCSATVSAAEALRLRLLGLRQSETASLLNISQVAVHKRLRKAASGHWGAIMQRYSGLVAPSGIHYQANTGHLALTYHPAYTGAQHANFGINGN